MGRALGAQAPYRIGRVMTRRFLMLTAARSCEGSEAEVAFVQSWVGVGFHMEFHADDQWIITSHVRSIAVERTTQRLDF